MIHICTSCINAPELISLINKEGHEVDGCDVCNSVNVKALSSENEKLHNLFRALIRYHYSEWDYNHHWGGDSIEALLDKENPITKYSSVVNTDNYYELIEQILSNPYVDYDAGVSLFAGYGEHGEQNRLLGALKNLSSNELSVIRHKLESLNYYLVENDALELIKPFIPVLERHIEVGTMFYRSRIGFAATATRLWDFNQDKHYKPYESSELGAPPPNLASAGRLNRPGVSFLYIATNEETAICEVRPHPGHHLSVGAFESLNPIRIADFSSISIADFCSSDKELDDYLLLKSIDDIFSLPIIPEERHQYSFTQFLSDTIRHLGFDGVGYKSSVGDGINLAIYDSRNFRYVNNSSKVTFVSGLKYTHEKVEQFNPEHLGDYQTDLDGNFI